MEGTTKPSDPLYLEGLLAAIQATLDHLLTGLEHGEDARPSIPPALLLQARRAAQLDVDLDLVLRRCVAGQTVLLDFLLGEGGPAPSHTGSLQSMVRTLAFLGDRLLDAVSEEYRAEVKEHLRSSERRLLGRVKRILAGEQSGGVDVDYDLTAHHLGLLAAGGDRIRHSLVTLAATIDRRLLFVRATSETAWAWFGGRRPFDNGQFECLRRHEWPDGVAVAIGEPGQGIDGLRLTHRQAEAAMPVALRTGGPVHYADVALLASALSDDLLATSLRRLYLHPLSLDRDGGAAARDTLRAYFAAAGNVSSAAAMLGVKRHTVTNRLRAIEGLLGRPLSRCQPELATALRIAEVDDDAGTDWPPRRP